jgi:SPP1 family predicted phage head-tail adaptor
MALDPGARDQLIAIERPARERDSFGGAAVQYWERIATSWARVIEERAREIVAAQRDAAERVVAFNVRAPLDVASGDRIIWADEAYSVTGIQPERRNGELVITARYVAGGDGR